LDSLCDRSRNSRRPPFLLLTVDIGQDQLGGADVFLQLEHMRQVLFYLGEDRQSSRRRLNKEQFERLSQKPGNNLGTISAEYRAVFFDSVSRQRT
jgi:hypothetical protein